MSKIYKITNKLNGKVYIGQTKRNITVRFADHLSHALVSQRPNDLNTKLYIAIREDGYKNFIVETIEEVEGTPKEIDEREIYWISFYDSTSIDKGYNTDKGGHTISEACRKAAEKHLFETGSKLEGKMLENARNNGTRAAKAICQYDKYTCECIAEYPSIIEASRTTGCDRRSIQRQLSGEANIGSVRSFSNLKYIWKYKQQDVEAS